MSTPAKHTPWKVQPNLSFGPAWEVADSAGSVIAACAEKATAHMIAAAPTMLEALKAQEHAENKNANCPDCEGVGDWAECGRCSELFGTAIELRRAALRALATSVLEREGK